MSLRHICMCMTSFNVKRRLLLSKQCCISGKVIQFINHICNGFIIETFVFLEENIVPPYVYSFTSYI